MKDFAWDLGYKSAKVFTDDCCTRSCDWISRFSIWVMELGIPAAVGHMSAYVRHLRIAECIILSLSTLCLLTRCLPCLLPSLQHHWANTSSPDLRYCLVAVNLCRGCANWWLFREFASGFFGSQPSLGRTVHTPQVCDSSSFSKLGAAAVLLC